jgi:hypothetical protein
MAAGVNSEDVMRLRWQLRTGRFGNRLACALVATPLLFTALAVSPATASVLIAVDKSAQEMSVSVDGVPKYSWAVSTGRPGYSTPSGKYTAFRMEEDHFSKEWDDAPMPNSIFFTMKGHAIHGTLDAKHLGSAASHGCVRLSTEHAKTLYALVKNEGLANTRVVIEGNERSAPLVAKRKGVAPDEAEVAARAEQNRQRLNQPTYAVPAPYQTYGSEGYPYSQYQGEAPVERDYYGRPVVRQQIPVRERPIVRGSASTQPFVPRYQQPEPQYYRQPNIYD